MDRTIFFSEIRADLFGGRMNGKQVAGCEAVLDAWDRHAPNSDLRFVAYSLATDYHETGRTMQPIDERGGAAYFTRMYDIRGARPAKARELGNIHPGDGAAYHGRGDTQLTGRRNYRFATARLRALGVIGADVDLEKNPELAKRPDIAAAILVFGMLEGWFTTRKLGDYFVGTRSDPIDARAIINGSDCATKISGYYAHFYHGLKVAYGLTAPDAAPAAPAKVARKKAAAPKVSRTVVKAAGKRRRVA